MLAAVVNHYSRYASIVGMVVQCKLFVDDGGVD